MGLLSQPAPLETLFFAFLREGGWGGGGGPKRRENNPPPFWGENHQSLTHAVYAFFSQVCFVGFFLAIFVTL